MARKKNTERTPALLSDRARLKGAIGVLQEEWGSNDARASALATLQDLRGKARRALLLIVAALDDRNESNRFQAYRILTDLCEGVTHQVSGLEQAVSSPDEKVRLDAISRVVRIVPEVQEARAKGTPGWPVLRELIRRARPGKEERMPQPRRKADSAGQESQAGTRRKRPRGTRQGRKDAAPVGSSSPAPGQGIDEATFYEVLPTAVRQPDDPVVRAMRENPGRWFVWNEVTREIYAITDDYNRAIEHIVNPADPNVKLNLAPGFHPDAPIHRPLKLLSWESPNVLDDVHLLWGDSADAWLDCPNPRFEGRKPRELVGTDDERFLRGLLRTVRYGGIS